MTVNEFFEAQEKEAGYYAVWQAETLRMNGGGVLNGFTGRIAVYSEWEGLEIIGEEEGEDWFEGKSNDDIKIKFLDYLNQE